MGKFVRFVSSALFLLLFSPSVFAADYSIDPDHSTVSFKIRHLFSKVQGQFTDFKGSFVYDPEKPETWKAEAVIQAASIDTNVEERDGHLRSADFFDAEKFPTLTFRSTGVTGVTPESAKLNGLLTIHGVERPVTLDLEIHGAGKDPWGNVRSGFTATVELNRKDFALGWNKVLETGQLLVGETVEVILEIEGILAETQTPL